jgi:hypothetical protein
MPAEAKRKEHPLLFKGGMVLAIMAGLKTQTRRVPTPQNSLLDDRRVGRTGQLREIWDGLFWRGAKVVPGEARFLVKDRQNEAHYISPIYQPGDGLWVRETWKPCVSGQLTKVGPDASGLLRYGIAFRADNAVVWRDHQTRVVELNGEATEPLQFRERAWRSPLHLRHMDARLFMEVMSVRAARLCDISEADAMAEGIKAFSNASGGYHFGVKVADCWESTAKGAFKRLWDSINGPRGYEWLSNPPVWALTFNRAKGGK